MFERGLGRKGFWAMIVAMWVSAYYYFKGVNKLIDRIMGKKKDEKHIPKDPSNR